ncbi:MAG: DUF5666 domain-containing protein [Pseudomonadota bacterium]
MTRLLWAALLAAAAVLGCQLPLPSDGIGGTGQRLADGIGGTGQRLEDGIGGTGIVGTVTDFGSIWLSDVRVEFDETTTIEANGQTRPADALEIGQVVAVLSDKLDARYRARRIAIVYEVIGAIATVDRSANRLTVLNQSITLGNAARVIRGDAAVSFADLTPGERVRVSGLRRADGSIVASLIESTPPSPTVQLVGTLRDGMLSGMPVVLASGLAGTTPAGRLRARGRLENGRVHIDSVALDDVAYTVAQSSELLIEGFLVDGAFEGDIAVGGIDIVLPAHVELDASIDFDQPVFIEAELGDDDLFYGNGLSVFPEDGGDYIDLFSDFDDFTDDEIDLFFE